MDGIFGIVHTIRADDDVIVDTVTAVGALGNAAGEKVHSLISTFTV